MVDSLTWLSRVFGYTYTVAWSLSFHPQVWKNYKRQSVQGVSLDFLYSNVAGFVAYAAYNVSLFASPEIRRQYFERYQSVPPIQLNDVIFPCYALLIASYTLAQSLYYKRDPDQRVSSVVKTGLTVFGVASVAVLLCCLIGTLAWLDFFNLLAFIKLVISALKYSPQVLENYRRQSTEAWSIAQILLDATGGIFSTAQLFLDAGRTDNWKSLTRGGLPKLLLGLLAMTFDTIFIIQHYVLYRHPSPGKEADERDPDERDPLLRN